LPWAITGSIAAYKAVELMRLFQNEGADVRVLMTTAAVEFIGTLTLETLSHQPGRLGRAVAARAMAG